MLLDKPFNIANRHSLTCAGDRLAATAGEFAYLLLAGELLLEPKPIRRALSTG